MIPACFTVSGSTRRILEGYCDAGAFPHTILIEGSTAEQRLHFARFIAGLMLCTGTGEKPCGVCSSCVKIKALSHPDLREYGDIASAAAFKVETCRAIRADCFIVPNDGDEKVYILKEVQNMNDSGENALLKIFEEPPRYVHFILTCASRSSMLETVLSRATVLSLGAGAETSPHCDETAQEAALKIARAVTEANELAVMQATAVLEKDRETFKNTLLYLSDIFRDALIVKSGGAVQEQNSQIPSFLAASLTMERLYALFNTVAELQNGVVSNQNHNLLLTSLCYKLRQAAGR